MRTHETSETPPVKPKGRAQASCSELFARLLALCLAAALALPLAARAENVAIPNYWDPKARPEKPDLSSIRSIRFLTDDDFPPMHFTDPDGNPAGFSVDLARAVCEKLKVPCTIQVRRFDTLLNSLADGRGDAIAAAIPITASLRERFAVTRPYHRMPARFLARRNAALAAPTAETLAGKSVGVVAGSAHEAYLAAFFPKAERRTYFDLTGVRGALRRGEVDYAFGDGMSLAMWIAGTDAENCCAFVGGPYLSLHFFGEGVGFIVRKDEAPLLRALDYATQALWDDGTYAELYLRYFPVSFY